MGCTIERTSQPDEFRMVNRYLLPEMEAVWSEKNKYDTWLKIELLAVKAWSKLGKISTKDCNNIIKNARYDIQRIAEIEETVQHDVIAFLTAVSENIGESGKYLHYGMTSSDMLDTALAVILKQASELLIKELKDLIRTTKNKAIEYQDVLMAGRTHGVHAEPITFGLKMAIWYFELCRSLKRLEAAKTSISYGKLSGAVGTYTTIDPAIEAFVCKELGLLPAEASSQIIQRDRHAELLTAIAITGASLEKIATEIRGLQRTEINEAEEPFSAKQKGSSAMPHKKNPIICERICGLARVLKGNALVAVENIALWHERDISHSSAERIILPDSTAALFYMLRKTNEVLLGLKVNKQKMLENLQIGGGVVFSQKVLLALIDAGMQREQAYSIIQKHAMNAHEGIVPFREAIEKDKQITDLLDKPYIGKIFSADDVIQSAKKIISRIKE